MNDYNAAIDVIARHARPLRGPDDVDELVERAREKQVVLLGEATHGTHEFYRMRAAITRRLLREAGFAAVAVEADWPDAYRINRYVRGLGGDATARDALGEFRRFPRWMWRNVEVQTFVEALRKDSEQRSAAERAGFYGLDLYSLHGSMAAVLSYLDGVDPEAARRARERYACFDLFGEEPQAYGFAASLSESESCEDQVVAQLSELRTRAWQYLSRDGWLAEDQQFCAERNAVVAQNAERYYREMYRGEVSSWNLRDQHMFDTLLALRAHLGRSGSRPGRLVVWAHNSHLGDARATAMARRGELNVGQLVRERFGNDALLVGFTTYAGTVAAADNWDEPVRLKTVLPARPDSFEALFHGVAFDRFHLNLRAPEVAAALDSSERLERAIGVVYRPRSELASHYFRAHISRQFDTVVHFDRTRPIEPLDPGLAWDRADLPETYPTGV